MKKRIHIWKCIAAMVTLLAFTVGCYAQKSLIDKQWQQRTQEILPELKKDWARIASTQSQPLTRSTESSQVDFLNAEYIPVPIFVLDYNSYMNLTPESNLEFLIKLDTTRINYVVKKEDKYIVQTGGIIRDGKWISNGFGIYSQTDIDFISKLFARGISYYSLYVFISPEQTLGYNIFYENGQLMASRGGPAQPLLEALIEYREIRLANPGRR